MTTTLVTGANKGLGFETARRLIAAGHTVWMGGRDADRGKRAADELGGRFVQLDVTEDDSVAAAAGLVADLDVLINNAGISGPYREQGDYTAADMAEVYATNVFGVVRVTHAFLPLLARSANPVIVNVSSGLASITRTLESDVPFPAMAYGSSKTAVNMLTVQYARAFPGMRINCVEPGYTATALNGFQGHQTVEEGAEVIVRMATIGPDGPTATYTDRHGVLPW
jgi:NAD(P)-dependent dehydrogenase (short-subunit alcohol dehydrogenase family)